MEDIAPERHVGPSAKNTRAGGVKGVARKSVAVALPGEAAAKSSPFGKKNLRGRGQFERQHEPGDGGCVGILGEGFPQTLIPSRVHHHVVIKIGDPIPFCLLPGAIAREIEPGPWFPHIANFRPLADERGGGIVRRRVIHHEDGERTTAGPQGLETAGQGIRAVTGADGDRE